MLSLITNPDEFFAEMKEKNPDLKKPAVIVLLLGILVAYYQFRLGVKIATALPPDLANFVVVSAYISVIGSAIGVLATWLIAAAIMHGLSAFFDGKGEFRRTFEFAGYGFLPSLLGSAITIPMSLNYVEKVVMPKVDVAELTADPEILAKAILSQIPAEYLHSALLLNLAVTIWGLLMWCFAVKNAREVSVGKAFVCAAIPTAIFGGYQILSMLRPA